MKKVGSFISFLLIILHSTRFTNCLCYLETETEMQCDKLEDIKYIDAHQLEKLKVSVIGSALDPKIFKHLNNLKHLDLSGGNLKRIEPGTFRTLINLKSLDLANNQLEYLNLSSLEGLHELRSLNLRRNNISQLPVVLLLLKNLKHLDVHGNPLQCNCATLHVRDLLTSRSVKLSKKVTCAGPNGSKGTSLMKLEMQRICKEEQDDKEMLGDQPYQGSGDFGSGDVFDEMDSNDELIENLESSEITQIEEVETPAPEILPVSNVEPSTTVLIQTTVEVSPPSISETPLPITPTEAPLEKSIKESEELFFDFEDQKHQITTEMSQKKKVKDSLFYPVEGSGDEGSGLEGSGIGLVPNEDDKSDEKMEDHGVYVSSTSEESIFSMILSVFTDTDATTEKKEPSIEEEGFMNVSVIKTFDNLGEVPVTKSRTNVTLATVPLPFSTIGPEIVESNEAEDMSKLGPIMVEPPEVAGMNNELAKVSPAKQSKKGMGSYVVLAGLLIILAGLVGFAAYKGDFCKKKRKRGDVENGTEMKDMQKSLLDTGNQAQPKIASNGSPENMPLVDGTIEHEDTKDSIRAQERDRAQNGHSDHIDHADPVKPPRKVLNTQEDSKPVQEALQDSISSKDDSFSERTSPVESARTTSPRLSEPNGPPLSPGAQRVKITLQENPDSVPKTPILITRTSVGDNLVKTP
ncbi:protein windpipe [Polistes fuscatus]|uniref:protein windpipe n=1 Tax=Polistes fuscatus TaxID=30207 RepID=UPI001CAA1621|nr:protein windpipe [Polistes fuscatus]XP_043494767.1 protein windpipe [Polistes fuscatus]